MRPTGISTGALARSDFQAAPGYGDAVEFSALRTPELRGLLEALPRVDRSRYRYVSVHAPSDFTVEEEARVASSLRDAVVGAGFPVIVHPDAIHDPRHWHGFGECLCFENMDRRKRTGRTCAELAGWFTLFPQATLCLDLAHARNVDPTMTEAYLILERFGPRLRQLHVSEVTTASRHERMSPGAVRAYREIANLVPLDIPVIVEGLPHGADVTGELRRASEAVTSVAVAAFVMTIAMLLVSRENR